MYQIEKVTYEDALCQLEKYEYALLYMISEVKLVKNPGRDQISEDQLQEAFFFNSVEELHLYREEDELTGKIFTEINEEHSVTKIYPVKTKFQGLGQHMIVKEYLEFDEDGQCHVGYTRLAGIR